MRDEKSVQTARERASNTNIIITLLYNSAQYTVGVVFVEDEYSEKQSFANNYNIEQVSVCIDGRTKTSTQT